MKDHHHHQYCDDHYHDHRYDDQRDYHYYDDHGDHVDENLLPLLLALSRISSELSPPMLLHWLDKEFDEDKRLLHAAALAGHNAEEHYVEDCEDHLEKC